MTNRYARRGGEAYHCSLDCRRISKPDAYFDRDEAYIDYHGLTPCKTCHDNLSHDRSGPQPYTARRVRD